MKLNWALKTFLIVSILANIGLGYVVTMNNNKILFHTNLLSNSTDTTSLLKEVSEIVELPSEKPSIIKIENVSVLKTQNPDFYNNALNGDIVFVFSNQAFIYRPSSRKLINFASISRL